jgi:invasion protein IalB
MVRAKMDAPMAQAFGTATQARVLIAGLDGKPVGLPFSTKGYADASAAFESAEGRRHSWWRRLWS